MGIMLYDGQPFRIDPESLRGGFEVKHNVTETLGGQVCQVYGVRWLDLVLEGSFGKGALRIGPYGPFRDSARDQEEFLARMIEIGERQAARLNTDPPQSLIWPGRGWNFQVYLKDYAGGDGEWSVTHDPTVNVPKWRLTFFVVTDNGNLTQRVTDQFIERLMKGLGWRQTEYNGPAEDLLAHRDSSGNWVAGNIDLTGKRKNGVTSLGGSVGGVLTADGAPLITGELNNVPSGPAVSLSATPAPVLDHLNPSATHQVSSVDFFHV